MLAFVPTFCDIIDTFAFGWFTHVHFRVVKAVLGGRFVEVGRVRWLWETDAVRPYKLQHF